MNDYQKQCSEREEWRLEIINKGWMVVGVVEQGRVEIRNKRGLKTDVEKIEFLSKLSNSKTLELKIDSTKVFLVFIYLFLLIICSLISFIPFSFLFLLFLYINSNMFFCLISSWRIWLFQKNGETPYHHHHIVSSI